MSVNLGCCVLISLVAVLDGFCEWLEPVIVSSKSRVDTKGALAHTKDQIE